MGKMHKNNFDFLRLLFALFVIITHSITLSGSSSCDPLQYVTAKQFTLSDFGLAGFFTISGYLVFESLKRSTSFFDYFRKRILRIYPGLVIALIITIILGCIVSNISIKEYFRNSSPWSYFVFHLLMFCQRPHFIQGVFERNPYPYEVNGSLWTIQYEFLFYTILSLLFLLRERRIFLIMLVVVSFFSAIIIYYAKDFLIPGYLYYYIKKPFQVFDYDFFFSFGFYFCSGVILANFKSFLQKYKIYLLFVSVLLSVIFVSQNVFIVASHFVLPIFIISSGLMQTKWINNLGNRMGDFSYGVYIYGFLIQQTLMNYFKYNYMELIFLTIPISLLCGYLSWNYIERPFLNLKKKKT